MYGIGVIYDLIKLKSFGLCKYIQYRKNRVFTCECGRTDDERGQLGQFLVVTLPVGAGHHHDGLQGLAEPHIVAEHAVQLVLVQEPQPVHAGLTIM